MKYFKKINLIRLGLLFGAIAIILSLLPHADHQSYTYELNQPWRYQLLTADFDMPILRDSTSAKRMKDSIDARFIPFITRDDTGAANNVQRFLNAVNGKAAPQEVAVLSALLSEVFERGVIDAKVYAHINSGIHPRLRVAKIKDGAGALETFDASEVLSPSKAFEFIDSAYSSRRQLEEHHPLEGEVAKALGISLTPNLLPDTYADIKYLNQ